MQRDLGRYIGRGGLKDLAEDARALLLLLLSDWPDFVELSCMSGLVWCEMEQEHDTGDLILRRLSEWPPLDEEAPPGQLPIHYLEYLEQEIGLMELARPWSGVSPDLSPEAAFLLEQGLAPFQPFLLRIDAWVDGPDYDGNYDDGFDSWVVLRLKPRIASEDLWPEVYFGTSLSIDDLLQDKETARCT